VREYVVSLISALESNGVDASQLAEDVEYFCGTIEAMFLHELKNSKVRPFQRHCYIYYFRPWSNTIPFCGSMACLQVLCPSVGMRVTQVFYASHKVATTFDKFLDVLVKTSVWGANEFRYL